MKEKLKQIGDRLSSFVSSHKKAATITASALLVLAGVLVIALVLSGGTKKNAQSEDDKKMLKDETVKVDKDKKKGENETTSADGKKNDKKDDKKDANSETKDANGETKDNKQSQTDNKTNNTGNKKTNVANNNSAAGNGAQAANNGTAATGNVAGQSGNTQSTNHGAANQNTNAGAASQGGQTQGGQAQGGGNTSGGNQSIPVTPMSSGTDTNQGNEEQLYNDLFNLGNRVTISLDIPDSEIQKLQDDYVRYGNGKSPIYRRVTKMTVTINNTSYNIYDVGVKMKGNTSRCPVYNNGDVNSRNLIHLKLSFDEAFDNTSYYGNEAINWDANLRKQRKSRTFATLDGLELKWNRNFDGTYVANYYGNIMFRNFGVYAQNTSLANVRFGGYNYGVYTIYEPVGKKFLKRYMPGANTGDLYKCGWSNKGANYTTDSLNSVGVETPNRQLTYDLKTNKTTSNHSSLKNLINQINSNSSKQTFANVVDANNFVMFAAVSYFEGNPDDLRNNFNNHYVYFRNGKAIFFPYDYDRCFYSS